MNMPEILENELSQCMSELGLQENGSIYITGNLGALGRVRVKKSLKQQIVLDSFRNNIGPNGTIFSPAASMNLCNTEIPFDINNTPSHEMGALAEYIRQLPGCVRSFHPFWSICGLGREAQRLKRVSRHAYGAGSPWSHFLDLDATQVNFGLHPSRAVTLIHHIETIVGVPYRYTKEFSHPVIVEGEVKRELFYQSVFYSKAHAVKRLKLNEHYFETLESKGLFKSTQHQSGLKLWSFKMRDFYEVALNFFIDDIYNYLESPPPERPYAV